MSIYVGNLSYNATQEDLTSVFEEYGKVNRVTLPTDRETGRPRGFAFVEMSSETEEDAAIEALDGAEWMGRELRVNKARPRQGGSRDRTSAPSDNRGGWGDSQDRGSRDREFSRW
ncbi:RNA-binding protein [Pseudanabaena sp. FACHB-2040]|uniref:RNA recognition motif domain-containing protein n=1 Tax=Pseudanabaena sp. FACHB-2040 TaxID=2692859 RepID=UPI00168980FB|nr:RNA-binding protein [Pseudanabaena sp. FACHB-2040]MBD2259721.1 RNA-binding protein [Pseudanabaena sp. FACHB-2040]